MKARQELVDRHFNIPVELDKKLDVISENQGAPKTFHIVSAIKAYLRKWESQHGSIKVNQ